MDIKDFLDNELEEIKRNNLYREFKVIQGAPDAEVWIDGKKYINFSSNDYLGLANDKRLKEKAIETIQMYSIGGTASRLLSGTTDLHRLAEFKLAEFKKTDDAIIFSCGYLCNLGVISSLLGDEDAVIVDRLNHASLIDAARLSKAKLYVYAHCDVNSLESVLKRTLNFKKRLIVTDTVFSMDGDIAPLDEIVALAERYDSWVMIDEAHATGVFGENLRGVAEVFNVEDKVQIKMGTLSKAIGCLGGFVCGDKKLIDYLRNKARTFIYTTALPPLICACVIEALKIIQENKDVGKTLLEKSENFRKKLNDSGFNTLNSKSQIIPIFIGDMEKTMKVSKFLFESNIFLPAIRPPTVPKGKCRLRVSLTMKHTATHTECLLYTLKKCLKESLTA